DAVGGLWVIQQCACCDANRLGAGRRWRLVCRSATCPGRASRCSRVKPRSASIADCLQIADSSLTIADRSNTTAWLTQSSPARFPETFSRDIRATIPWYPTSSSIYSSYVIHSCQEERYV